MDKGAPKDNKPPAPANSGISSLKNLKPKDPVSIKPKDDQLASNRGGVSKSPEKN